MKTMVRLDTIYSPSEEVVAREVAGEFIIIPIASGIADLDDAIFTFNETGRAIWNKLDGKKNLKNVIDELSLEFKAPSTEIEKGVLGLTKELLKRRILVEIKRD